VVADATTCIGLDPKFSDCLDRRGYAYDKLGKSDLALADLDESLRLAPQSAWTLVTRGNVRKDKQLVDLAMTDYTEAIRLDPKRDLAYANRADAYLIKQQYPLAIADATKAIEINPRRWFAFAVRGFALFDSGRLDEASSDLAQAVQQYPKWVKPRYWYAVAEARLEEKTYDSCPKGGNRRPDASTTVGGLPVCMKGLEFNNSLRELTEVIRLNPEHSDAYAYRGYLYIKLNQRERAISDLRRAVQINPNNTTARNNLRSLGVAP
jgi:tetratricopeptide (TPR) repeat protein